MPVGGFDPVPVDDEEPLGVVGETEPVAPLDFSTGEFPVVSLELIPLPVSLALVAPDDELVDGAVPAAPADCARAVEPRTIAAATARSVGFMISSNLTFW
jgi:hypothetical protein